MARKKRRKKSARKARRRAPHSVGARYIKFVADASVFCFTALIGLAAVFAYVARDLPDTGALWDNQSGPKITLLAADGSPLAVHGASMGAPVRLSELPQHVPDAVLAVEDRNFYHHFGVNPVSIVRALIVNARQGVVVQGGSTITQQLAKNIFLTPEQTINRKAQELLLALWLEQKFTKEEILTLYMNRVYFGGGAYGVDAASYRYFGKPAKKLSIGEAAVLAGLLKAPSRLAPTSNPDDAGRRGRLVVEKMRQAGMLTESEANAAIARPILLSTSKFSIAPYFVDYILGQVRVHVGELDEDLIVQTTLDQNIQNAAETGLIAGVASAEEDISSAQAAIVILNDDGAVKAMIGGRDYRESQFNRATQARRQPGSAFKPIVYLAAAERGLKGGDRVLDAPLTIGKWTPDNYKSKFYGEVTAQEALARSLNAAAIRVQEAAGRETVRRQARALGWTGPLTNGPALALGVDAVTPLELAGVYAAFSNHGYRVRPYVIKHIKTGAGDMIYQHGSAFLDQAASRSAVDAVNRMMRNVVSWGTGRAAAVPGYAVAGKTGTTQNNRDAWFVGHAAGLVGVVWIGRDDNKPMIEVTGGRAPAIIWREVMARALPPAIAVAPSYAAPLQIESDPIAAMLRGEHPD